MAGSVPAPPALQVSPLVRALCLLVLLLMLVAGGYGASMALRYMHHISV